MIEIFGIYKITNIVNNKVYIGQSIDVEKRIQQHKYGLNNNKGHNAHFQNAWNKYGENNFKFEIIEKVEDASKLNELEIEYISEYNSTNPDYGYNWQSGGDNYSCRQEFRDNISKRMRGKYSTLRNEDVLDIKLLLCCGINKDEICSEYNLRKNTLNGIINGNSFNYILPEAKEIIKKNNEQAKELKEKSILDMCNNGFSITEISKELPYSISVIEKTIYQKTNTVENKKKKYQKIFDEVHYLYNEKGMKKYQIAKKLNISPSTVDRYLKKENNPYKDLNFKKMTDSVFGQILNLYNNGESINSLSDKFNISRQTISFYIEKYANTEVS